MQCLCRLGGRCKLEELQVSVKKDPTYRVEKMTLLRRELQLFV